MKRGRRHDVVDMSAARTSEVVLGEKSKGEMSMRDRVRTRRNMEFGTERGRGNGKRSKRRRWTTVIEARRQDEPARQSGCRCNPGLHSIGFFRSSNVAAHDPPSPIPRVSLLDVAILHFCDQILS